MGFPFLRLAAFVLIVSGLSAQTPDQPEKNQGSGQCDNAITTADMRACEGSRYASAERALNAAYQGARAHLDNGQKEKLRLAQRAWLRFRDSNADFQASLVQGGTLAPLVRISVLTDMTKARAHELKKKILP